MFKYRHGPRPFVSLFLCCTVIGIVFDYVLILIINHLLADSSHLLGHFNASLFCLGLSTIIHVYIYNAYYLWV